MDIILPILRIPIALYNRLHRIFIQADQHINHDSIFKTRHSDNIINIHYMNDMIIKQFQKLDKFSDIYLVGDFYSVDWFPYTFLNQNVYVMMGNHELASEKGLEYKKNKIAELNQIEGYNITIISDPYTIPGTSITLTHDPNKTIKRELLPEELIIHGHYHNMNGEGAMSGIYKLDIGKWPESQYINVAADMTEDFKIFNLKELLYDKYVPYYPYYN